MTDTTHTVPHTPTCLASAVISAVENARDATADGCGYDTEQFRRNVTRALDTAEGYLADGLSTCRCPDTDRRACRYCSRTIYRHRAWTGASVWRTGDDEVWCQSRRPAVLPHVIDTHRVGTGALRAGMVVQVTDRMDVLRVRLDTLAQSWRDEDGRQITAWTGPVIGGSAPGGYRTVRGDDHVTWTVEA